MKDYTDKELVEKITLRKEAIAAHTFTIDECRKEQERRKNLNEIELCYHTLRKAKDSFGFYFTRRDGKDDSYLAIKDMDRITEFYQAWKERQK